MSRDGQDLPARRQEGDLSRALRASGAGIAKGTGKLLLRGGLRGVRAAWNALRHESRELGNETREMWTHLRPDDSRTQAYALAGGVLGRKVGDLVDDVRAIGGRLRSAYRKRQYGRWCDETMPGMRDAIDELVERYGSQMTLTAELNREGFDTFTIRQDPQAITVAYRLLRQTPGSTTAAGPGFHAVDAVVGELALDLTARDTSLAVGLLPAMGDALGKTIGELATYDTYRVEGSPVPDIESPLRLLLDAQATAQPAQIAVTMYAADRRGRPVVRLTYAQQGILLEDPSRATHDDHMSTAHGAQAPRDVSEE